MRIYPSKTIREWDRYSMKVEGISSFQLMQRAAFVCFLWIKKRTGRAEKISVCCGPGNNGGDGLLIAAYLFQYGYRVQVYADETQGSGDRMAALAYCKTQGLQPQPLFELESDADLLIDALFGHGMERPLSGDFTNLVNRINASRAKRISIDIPSGMPSEAQPEVFTVMVHAHSVLSFQQPKLSFFLDEYGSQIGEWEVVDIGLSATFPDSDAPILLEANWIAWHFKSKVRFSHKGTYGSSLLVGGSENYPGAISLATRACLLTGVGKTFVATAPGARAACLVQAPEAIYIPGEIPESLIKEIKNQSFACIAVGPGFGRDDENSRFLRELFHIRSRWVIDADALNLIASGKVGLPEGEKVITPHPGEFDRLTRTHTSIADRWRTARVWSREHATVVVLKGVYTAVFFPDGRQYINSTGNEGMAKGGSGDVLCGWIAGYMGRGYPVDEAVLIAVYLHGLAADLAVTKVAKEALKAGDIIRFGERVAKKWEN